MKKLQVFTKNFRALLAVGVLFAVGGLSPRVEAATVVANYFFNQLNKISDNSGEFLFNRAGGATTLDVGDLLITQLAIDTIEDLTGGGGTRSFLGGSGNNEFTGFSAIEATAVGGGPGAFTFAFGPVSAAGRAAVSASMGAASNVSTLLSGMAPTSMVLLMDDGAVHNYQRNFSGTFAGSGPDDVPGGPNPPGDIGIGPFVKEDLLTGSIKDVGTKITEFGFTGPAGVAGVGESWSAVAPSADVALVAIGSPALNFGTVNFGINVTANPAGIIYGHVIGPGGLVNFAGNANLQGVGLGTIDFANTPFDAFDDFNATFRPLSVVPEPGSLVLFSLVVGGLLARRRRASSKQ